MTFLLEHERLYGKDGDCPAEWTEWLESGAIPDDLLFNGSNDFLKFLPDEVCCRFLFPFYRLISLGQGPDSYVLHGRRGHVHTIS